MVHRNSQVLKAECAPAGDGFSGRTGLLGRIRMRGDRKKVMALISKEMRNGKSESHMGEALTMFAELSPEHKMKLMKEAQDALAGLSDFPFESPERAHAVKTLADFFSETARHIPETGDGEKKGFEKAMRSLAAVVEHVDPHGEEENYPDVLRACAAALWELGYPRYEFWEEHIQDPVTRSTVVDKLLDHEESLEDFEAHGWSILSGKFKEIAPALARSGSQRKEAFLRFMIETKDPHNMALAFKVAASLDRLPEDFQILIKELPDDHFAKAEGLDLIKIAGLAEATREHSDSRFFAVLELLDMHHCGRGELMPVLERIATRLGQEKDPDRKKVAAYAISRIGLPESGSGIQKAVDDLLDSGSGLCVKVLRHELYFSMQHVAQSGSDKKIEFLIDATKDGNPAIVADALSSAALLSEIPQEFLDISYSILKDPMQQHLHTVAYGFVDSYYINKVRKAGKEEQKKVLKELKRMAYSGDPHVSRAAFVAALHLQHAPLGTWAMKNAAQHILGSEDGKSLWNIVHDYLKLKGLIMQSERADEKQFLAVRELTRLYTKGRPYLYPILHDMAVEMSDVFHDPAGKDDSDMMFQKAAALYTVWHLTRLGIPASTGVNPQAVVNVLLEHENEGGWDLLREDAPMIASLIANSDTPHSVDFLVDMARDEDLQTAANALQIASLTESKRSAVRYAAYDILEDGSRAPLHPMADDFLTISYINLAKGNDGGREETFREMLDSGEELDMKYALEAGIYISDIPEEFITKAMGIAEEDSILGRKAQVFLDALSLKEKLSDSGTWLGAIPPLVKLYAGGAGHLGPMLLEEAQELSDAIRKDKGMLERQETVDALAALAMARIPVPGLDLEIVREV